MSTIKHILCPVDYSDFSAIAYDYAQSMADHYHASLTLLHVVGPGAGEYFWVGANNLINRDLEDYAADHIKQFAHAHERSGLKPETCTRVGPVRKTILDMAMKKNADLIVMGTHGHSQAVRGMLGSVTEYVLRHTSCSVLAVRRPRSDSKGGETVRIQNILFCTDLSPHSERALNYALSLAGEYAAGLTLLHVMEDVSVKHSLEEEIAQAKAEAERPIPKEAYERCTIKTLVRIGKASEEIVKAEVESEADLVVLGIHGRNVVDLAFVGSTTHRVLQSGSCPVITVAVDRPLAEAAQPADKVA